MRLDGPKYQQKEAKISTHMVGNHYDHPKYAPKKRLLLINVNPKERQQEGAPPLNHNGALDEIRKVMGCTKMTKNRLIKSHNGNQEYLQNANVMEPLKQSLS
jgi:hypothetical protein